MGLSGLLPKQKIYAESPCRFCRCQRDGTTRDGDGKACATSVTLLFYGNPRNQKEPEKKEEGKEEEKERGKKGGKGGGGANKKCYTDTKDLIAG